MCVVYVVDVVGLYGYVIEVGWVFDVGGGVVLFV